MSLSMFATVEMTPNMSFGEFGSLVVVLGESTEEWERSSAAWRTAVVVGAGDAGWAAGAMEVSVVEAGEASWFEEQVCLLCLPWQAEQGVSRRAMSAEVEVGWPWSLAAICGMSDKV